MIWISDTRFMVVYKNLEKLTAKKNFGEGRKVK